jgi:hypothetical protein
MSAKARLTAQELVAYAHQIAALPRFDISPAEAAPLLGSDGYSLNIAAKNGRLGSIEHFFAGVNLRLSKASVLKFIGYEGSVIEWHEAH